MQKESYYTGNALNATTKTTNKTDDTNVPKTGIVISSVAIVVLVAAGALTYILVRKKKKA